jgi:hypothetical protein
MPVEALVDRQVKEQQARVAEIRRKIRAAEVEQRKLRQLCLRVREENRGIRLQINIVVCQKMVEHG